jgi:actin-like ATPase involved in cell morphogenesis
MNNKPVTIIGFDLGHGEISLAKIQANQHDREPPKPMLLHRQKCQPAAIAYHSNQGVLFGEQAFLDGPNGFKIAFKKKPSPSLTLHDEKTLQNFVKAIHTHLTQTYQLDDKDDRHFFVGCPSGWKDEEVAAYEKILRECLPVVTVVRESRAALMHAKESGVLDEEERSKSVLVIDIGSSTTDLTLIKGRDSTPIDFGFELGASLIDKAILDYSLAQYPPAHQQQIQEFFQKISASRHRCEFLCRKAKEAYFSFETSYQEKMVNVGYEKFQQTGIKFEPRINQSIMEEILNQKLPSLGNKDWITCFRDLLTKTKQELDNKNIQVSAVFLTGGASKMSFISKIVVEDVFPDSRLQPDSEHELCIAFGLARWGRISLRTQSFIKEVNQTIDQKLEDIVSSNFYILKDELALTLTGGLLKEVIKPCMHAWREGDIETLNDLEPEMQDRALEWLEKPEIKKRIEEKILTWMNKVQKNLETEINPICEKYKLPSGNIQLEPITSETATKDLQDVMNKDKLTPTLDFLTSTLLPIVAGIVPTLILGPIGLLIGILAAIAVKFWGGEKSKELISNQNIPGLIRKRILTDNKIDEIIEGKQLELKKSIKDKLDEQRPVLIDHLVEDLSKQIKAGIKEQADKDSFLIA